MKSERIDALRTAFPQLPADYWRVLARVEAGQQRFGLQWLDGPQHPGEVAGAAVAAGFPSTVWIGRRAGDLVGYALDAPGGAALCQWGGSRQQLRRRYATFDALILSQRAEGRDSRPVVRLDFALPGFAFGSWHDGGTLRVADCILSPGLESQATDHLLDAMQPGWELVLTHPDNDSWLCVRRGASGLELCDARHGSAGDWRAASRAAAGAAMLALAPSNDGSTPWAFANFTLWAEPPA